MTESRVVVLIDARNVLRSRWPNVPAVELIDRCRRWAHANGACALVVFDGRAPGGTLGEHERDPACGIVGSGGESADDWITRRAADLTSAGRSYWLVTSDRELRRRAGMNAEKHVGGGGFLTLLDGVADPPA